MKTNKKDSKKNSKKTTDKKIKKEKNNKEEIINDKIQWTYKKDDQRNINENLDYKIEPIKVIYKYKNLNRKNQYLTYIFLGILGKKYEKILKRIETLDIYQSLLEITKDEELKLIDGFGELWMTKFFNIHHISSFVNKLETKPELKKNLLKKYDITWLTNFIEKFKTDIVFKKVNYSFSELVKFQYKIKMGKKIEKVVIEKEDIDDLNFTTEKKKSKNLLDVFKYNQKGGDVNKLNIYTGKSLIGNNKDDSSDSNYSNDLSYNFSENLIDTNSDTNYLSDFEQIGGFDDNDEKFEQDGQIDLGDPDDIEIDNLYSSEIIDNEDDNVLNFISSEPDDEINYEEIEKLYQTDEIDNNINTTNTMISNVLGDNKIVEKKENYLVKFDDYQDNDIDDEKLSNVYNKKFIYTQYIFIDDSIKDIKNKICATIKGNDRISSNTFLIPSRTYIWSEYIYDNKIEKIMIGQKWMKKNELLNIDIEPLDIINYENLESVIKNLRDSMKRYSGKIRRDDEDNNILYDYQDYLLNDTIYLTDIYNELGQDYKCNQEQLKNITETFFRIYYPKIKIDDIPDIINFLNKKNEKVEKTKIKNSFEVIYNDLLIEREITELIELTKIKKKKEYSEIFEPGNFIIQSVIHVNLIIYDELLEKENKENIIKINKIKGEYGTVILPKLDLFRIFNDFTPDLKCPFIQYQIPNGQIIFKYHDDYMSEFSKSKNNINMITKWFENSPYGISFKIKITNDKNGDLTDKFMAINVNEIGKIEYKATWKEEDFANMRDVINTYEYVKDLIKKINEILINHPRNISIKIPEDYEFRFAFINCIQKFKIPNDKIINHNDFSDFCVYFYPYVSLQVEPKKRIGKLAQHDTKSKYGSYLRYKRVSKFDSTVKIEQKILSYIRNYDFEDDILTEEISKQFNITNEKALEEIQKIKAKYPNIIKGKKGQMIKTTEMPKFKAPGIGIDIQGKTPEKYKIRINGAREQKQLERIIIFMNILMYLYYETYINKNPEYQEIKNKLKKLTNIAKRRGKVDEIVNYQKEQAEIKQMTKIDKKRLGYKPEEGGDQWSRLCQNSGNDKKRRPTQTLIGDISKLVSKGYLLNKKTGEYEKKVLIKGKNKKSIEMTLKTIKLTNVDETTGQSKDIYYTCDPEDNGTHFFVGFLTRSNNPFGECMPCCFKKNKFETKKKETIEFYKKCLDESNTNKENNKSVLTGDILYILQDTNKIQEGRMGDLPKYLELIININLNKTKKIKNHYLLKTDSYFFKLGINHDEYSFINTLAIVLNISIDEIKDIITKFLKIDTDEIYYFSLNDGDIRAEYRINDFIRFIQESQYIDFYYLNDLMMIPGLFTARGIMTIILNKSSTIIKKGVEREKINDDFYLLINKTMVFDYEYYLQMFNDKDLLFIIKDGKYYYPIIEIIKKEENTKNIEIKKIFSDLNQNDVKIIEFMKNFFIKTIEDIRMDYIFTHTTAKETYSILSKISEKKKEYAVSNQVIDSRFKCKFLLTKDNYVIPVVPSGIINELSTICLNTVEYGERPDCFSKINFLSINETHKYLEDLYKLSNKKLNIKPIGLFYDFISEDNFVNIIGIMTSNNDLVPVKKQLIPIKELKKNNVNYQNRPLYHELDMKLIKYNKNYFDVIDNRIKNVNKVKFIDESYQLFRFELSNLLSDKKYESIKIKLKKLIDEKNNIEIQELLLKLCVSKIDNKTINKEIVGNELVKIIDELPNLDYYKINNQRQICEKLEENKCIENLHCKYIVDTTISKSKAKSQCKFALTKKYLFEFIKKISVELCEQEIKAFELLKEKKYYIQDIVDYNNFTEKAGQKIINSSNTNLKKILSNIFGKEHVPKIGRRYLEKKTDIDIQSIILKNPIKDIKNAYLQNIILFNYSIIRAYVNGYYWYKHKLYTIDIRNLGYYSEIQNELVNLLRASIVDWLNVPDNIILLTNLQDSVKKILANPIVNINFDNNALNKSRPIINNYIVKLMKVNIEDNFGFFELFIFNKLHKIPIIFIVNGVPKYHFHKNNINLIKNNHDDYLNSANICISIDINQNNKYPDLIEIFYYK